MNNSFKYFIPLAFLVLAGFNLYNSNWLEALLYLCVGSAFPLMWAIKDGNITSNLKFWNALSWGLIILALFLFLLLLRTDAYNAT
jgi:hypothetical protein